MLYGWCAQRREDNRNTANQTVPHSAKEASVTIIPAAAGDRGVSPRSGRAAILYSDPSGTRRDCDNATRYSYPPSFLLAPIPPIISSPRRNKRAAVLYGSTDPDRAGRRRPLRLQNGAAHFSALALGFCY